MSKETLTTIPPVSNWEAWTEYYTKMSEEYVLGEHEQHAFEAGWGAGLRAAKWARDFEEEQYRRSRNG